MADIDTDTDTDTDTLPLRVGIVLFDGIEPLDFVGPAQVFWSMGSARAVLAPMRPVDVQLVAETAAPVRAGYGLVVHPTITYADSPQYDVIIVPGGTGGEEEDGLATIGRRFQASHDVTLDFLREQAAGAEVMASVCTGAFVLAGAGLLAGRRANTHWHARDELVAFMAERGEDFTLEVARVVDDGDLVTAGGVSSGIDLALHLVERYFGRPCRDATAMVLEQETPVPV